MIPTVWYLNWVKIIFPEILHMRFVEAVVDTYCVRDEWASNAKIKWKLHIWHTSCLLCNSTRTAGMEGGYGGWTEGWKRRRVEASQGGGSQVGEEGGSEAEKTKEERKERGSEVVRRKEETVGPSKEARHSRRIVPAWLQRIEPDLFFVRGSKSIRFSVRAETYLVLIYGSKLICFLAWGSELTSCTGWKTTFF